MRPGLSTEICSSRTQDHGIIEVGENLKGTLPTLFVNVLGETETQKGEGPVQGVQGDRLESGAILGCLLGQSFPKRQAGT